MNWLSVPNHVRGEIHNANAIPKSHWQIIKRTKTRSVCLTMFCSCSPNSSLVRRETMPDSMSMFVVDGFIARFLVAKFCIGSIMNSQRLAFLYALSQPGYQCNNAIFTPIITGMTSAFRYPAIKKQSSMIVIKQDISGRFSPKNMRLFAVNVLIHRNARKGSRTMP